MKVLVQRISASPFYARAFEWSKLLAITGGTQATIQCFGLVGGILVIRLLPSQEYALYTLANTMLGTMSILADGGITAGVLSQGGKVWQDREELGVVLATGLDLRKKFAIGSLLTATPILFYLLIHHGASWLISILIISSLIPVFFTALSGSILGIAPMLHQDVLSFQKNQIIASLGRLILTAFTLIAFPWAYIAILAAGLPQIWTNFKLRKMSVVYADWNQQPSEPIRNEILSFVKRILPGSIYYCISGQITIWLISIFGSTASIAQVGALGRLVIALSIISSVFGTLAIPRFARLPNKASTLLARYLLMQGSLVLISCLIIAVTWLFPAQILWVLGRNYSGLKTELILTIVNGCLGLLAGASFSTSTSRGWAVNPLLSIPITILALAIGINMFDITSLKGVLVMNIFITSTEVALYVVYNLVKIFSTRTVEA